MKSPGTWKIAVFRRQALYGEKPIRCDSGGGTHEFVAWLAKRGQWLSYSVGMAVTDPIHAAVLKVPAGAWTSAV